jgi:effector-binding domain-containing protein
MLMPLLPPLPQTKRPISMKRNLATVALGVALPLLALPPSTAQTGTTPPPVQTVPPPPGPNTQRPTLVPAPADAAEVAEVTLPGKPAAIVSGTSTWEEGVENLKKAFGKLNEELTRAGMQAAGRPLTVFTQTDDMSFRYDAMVPVAAAPEGRPSLSPEVRFGRTPAGKALRFEHKGPYDGIDTTYETITAYLDLKGLTAEDAFVEEYATDLVDPSDPALEVNIYALLR